MIPRYSRKLLKDIWEDQNKFQIWLDIEILASSAMEQLGQIPKGTTSKIKKKAKFKVKEIEQIEKKTKHDVIAFLTNVAKYVGPESRFIHKGLTSSDILDTSFSIQLSQASHIIKKGLEDYGKVLKKLALKHKHTVCIGRSHGIHAETTTFGLKILGYFEENKRNLERLKKAINQIQTIQMSGPIGTYSNIDQRVEKIVAKKLKFSIEPVSTQIIPRDRHAELFSVFSLIASSLERLATEIRHLQRTEVLEVEEGFGKGQKGSSAMPHKKNPILSENVSGLAKVIRSLVIPALENITTWHERDISHSSVERINAPNATITLDFAVQRMISAIPLHASCGVIMGYYVGLAKFSSRSRNLLLKGVLLATLLHGIYNYFILVDNGIYSVFSVIALILGIYLANKAIKIHQFDSQIKSLIELTEIKYFLNLFPFFIYLLIQMLNCYEKLIEPFPFLGYVSLTPQRSQCNCYSQKD